MKKATSTAEIGRFGNDAHVPMRAYKLPSGAWFDEGTQTLHVPTQPNDRMEHVANALAGHPLAETLIAQVSEQLETWSLSCYMLGHQE